MSLIVWYPFTKNFNSQGIGRITATTYSDVSLQNSNLFGTAASFTGTSNSKIALEDFPAETCFGNTGWSISFWCKYKNDGERGIILGSYTNTADSKKINIEINGGTHTENNIRLYWYTGTTNVDYHSTVTLDINKWTHVCIVSTGTKIDFYKNGEFTSTTNKAITFSGVTDKFWFGTDNRGSNRLYGELNDFRVYNHTLSKKEITERAKGLILHYALKGNAIHPNTILQEDDLSGNGNNGILDGITFTTDSPRYTKSAEFDTLKKLTFNQIFHQNDQVSNLSISIWTKFTNSIANTIWNLGQNTFWRVKAYSNTQLQNLIYMGSSLVDFKLNFGQSLVTNTWYHLVLIFNEGIIKMYLNGVLADTSDKTATGTTINCSANDTRWSLGDYTANSEAFVGKLSDFRIYAKALTTEDVTKLYQMGGAIDNTGKFYCGELIEEQ